MCTICSRFHAYQPDCAYQGPAATADAAAGRADGGAGTQAALPVFTLDQIAYQLTDAYWTNQGDIRAGFNASVGDTITVNITALTAEGQQLARWALEAWTAVSGLNFAETGGAAQITFDDEASGAYANSSLSGGYLTSSFVNVSKFNWLPVYGTTIDSYSFQTYIHEIGHALGLGHAGHYNGSASYSQTGSGSNHYLNDSWQATVMSYFDQVENTFIAADYAYVTTTMQADVVAIQDLYGTAVSHNPGNTTYGANSNLGGYLGDLFGQIFAEDPADPALYSGARVALTVFDTGGIDTLDFSPVSAAQTIDLGDAAISDVGGATGTLAIARGTVIENAIGGSGNDTLLGNGADNMLNGGGGDDSLSGFDGADTLHGGGNADTLRGGGGNDRLLGDDGSDDLFGEANPDRLLGGGGSDYQNGGGGSDTLLGGAGGDELFGGPGGDLLRGETGSDNLMGGDDGDTLRGGGENDTLSGGADADRLFGEADDDRLWGGDQSDTLLGGDGEDTLFGELGDDRLLGGADGDRLFGGDGIDVLFGEAGDDLLDGGGDDDRLYGGPGDDRFVFADGFGDDRLMDFDTVALEKIDLSAVTAIVSYADLTDPGAGHLYQSGVNSVIDDLAGNTILILGVAPGDLTADHFLF
ncbi:MAG: M10 family metallopeptidase [Rhodobacter sp.]|nr:M10 family metallopeptidase [Rhodobacter sp.]